MVLTVPNTLPQIVAPQYLIDRSNKRYCTSPLAGPLRHYRHYKQGQDKSLNCYSVYEENNYFNRKISILLCHILRMSKLLQPITYQHKLNFRQHNDSHIFSRWNQRQNQRNKSSIYTNII